MLFYSAWRHWGCVTPKIITNMKKSLEAVDELDGFEDLNPEDQAKIRKAWQDGHVADEDVPDSARKPEEEDEEEDEDESGWEDVEDNADLIEEKKNVS